MEHQDQTVREILRSIGDAFSSFRSEAERFVLDSTPGELFTTTLIWVAFAFLAYAYFRWANKKPTEEEKLQLQETSNRLVASFLNLFPDALLQLVGLKPRDRPLISVSAKLKFLEATGGIFGWVWILASIATIVFVFFALFFEGRWIWVLPAIAVAVVSKSLLREFMNNQNRVGYEAKLIARGLTKRDAHRAWLEVRSGGRDALGEMESDRLGVPGPFSTGNFSTEMTTPFFQGNVSVETFDSDRTQFRIVDNNGLVSMRNDTHLRMVEDIMKTASMPHFEVIAPMTAVEVIEGKVPDSCLHEYSLAHYLALRKHYTGE